MRALVTGSTHGLGKAIRESLEAFGYEVIDLPGSYLYSRDHVQQYMRGIRGECPKVIINNYGINRLAPIGEAPASIDTILTVNLMGPYWVVDSAVALGWTPCRVINIVSQTYRVPQRMTTIYCASKAGLAHMTKVMARELAPKGWVINAVSPGKIEDTNMSRLTDEQVLELRGWTREEADAYALKNIPMGRFTNTKEIAEVVLTTLLMPPYVNGTVIEAHGGV